MASDEQSKPKPKITLYWLDQSRATRILWLLEELKVEYEVKVFRRGKDMLAPPELKEVHPLGKSPVVSIQIDGAEKPLVLAESGLIIEYLTEHFGQWLIPKRYQDGKEGHVGAETEEWLRYRYYMHYGEGTLMPYMVFALVMRTVKNAPVPFFIKPIVRMIVGNIETRMLEPNFATNFAFLENQLATAPQGGGFFCGNELTGADILMSFPMEAATLRAGATKEKNPKMVEYVERLHAREAYKRAQAKTQEFTGKQSSML